MHAVSATRWRVAGVVLALLAAFLVIQRARSPKPADARGAEHSADDGPKSTVSDEPVPETRSGVQQRDVTSTLTSELATTLVVRTTDLEGSPLPSVELFAETDAQEVPMGRTDVTGAITISRRPQPEFRIRARYHGRFEAQADVSIGSTEVVIAVDAGGLVSGRVVFPGGTPVPAGIHVLAWSMADTRPAREFASDALHERDGLHAVTSSDGRFEIRGFDRSQTYYVTAGGDGLMRKQPLRAIAPDAIDLSIEVDVAFGAVVSLLDAQSHEPVRVPGSFWPFGAVKTRVDDATLTHFVPGGAESILAGVDAKWFEHRDSYSHHVTLCSSPSRRESVGPFTIHAELPGYEPVEAEFFAEPLSQGVHQVELLLTPRATHWGQLQVESVGILAGGPVATRTRLPAGFVVLRDERGGTLRYAMSELGTGHWTFEPIPVGQYRATVVLHSGLTRLPPGEALSISIQSEPATLLFPVDQLGTVEVLVRDEDRATYTAAMTLDVERQSGATHSVGFESAPYLVQGLTPGEYSIRVLSPFLSRSAADGGTGQIVIRGGEVSVLEFSAP